ncbi:uncharacterized protein LOC107633037 [Arachis ipaensis]|uniref:uncharacterized protein LOC107633037 n=1 Tax=Arachis ipaensis TaxID=130454 RepID=UPI0007AF8D19|nr:uncharacterized protein LOC107633037 [Arachis ipaensis]XP_025638910.1 uncharacterized protein LOC112733977 [Arachis hypogaea]
MGFGRRWREWVKECVGTASMSILVNGSPSKPFKMERGLRQGDPLSPFLFVLVVDVLHKMVEKAVRNRRIMPLLVGKDNIELSHLQFADDTILFCPPEEETIRNYARLLRCFEVMSGLTISFDKSSLIPINCEQQWTYDMCNLLGCKEACLPIKFLGIPLGANPRLVRTWKPIIDKVEEKLSLWKAKVLNKAAQKLPTRGGPWKDICQLQFRNDAVKDKMIAGLSMEVGDRRRTRFWEDLWLQSGPLKMSFPRLFSVSNQKGSVIGDCGFWDGLEWIWNFQWRRDLYQWELDLVVQLHETLRPVKLEHDKQDRIYWKFDKEGVVSMAI